MVITTTILPLGEEAMLTTTMMDICIARRGMGVGMSTTLMITTSTTLMGICDAEVASFEKVGLVPKCIES